MDANKPSQAEGDDPTPERPGEQDQQPIPGRPSQAEGDEGDAPSTGAG